MYAHHSMYVMYAMYVRMEGGVCMLVSMRTSVCMFMYDHVCMHMYVCMYKSRQFPTNMRQTVELPENSVADPALGCKAAS